MGKLVKKKQPIAEAQTRPWTTGDFVIKNDGQLCKIGKVNKKEFELLHCHDNEWSHYGSHTWDDRDNKYWTKLEKSLEECEVDLIHELSTDFASFESGPASDSTEIALISGKDQAIAAKQALEETTRKLALLEAVMKRKKNQLENIRRHFQDQLEKINRVVNIIELYLGISEEIVQIAEGEPAPIGEPISFRQLCLHMDEEAADLFTGEINHKGRHTDDIDFMNLDRFDDWIRKNYNQVLPEAKGIVVCRPRRTDKDYRLGNDPMDIFTQSEMNKENYRTYYLIRNGRNLYRISSDKIHIYPVLFPSQEEFKKLSTPDEDGNLSKDQKEKLLAYQRNVLMLQGLIDRTDVFKPMPPGVNLLKPETYGEAIRFIFDAENLLGDGHPEFWDWLKGINAQTVRGDRLYFTRFDWDEFRPEGKEDRTALLVRFPIPGWDHHRPDKGLYTVVRIENYQRWYWSSAKTEPSFVCHFNPKDTVWKRRTYYSRFEEKERKMSIPFRLFADDHFVVNYEHVTREDAEYYFKDRVNRQHYMNMIPLIRGILKSKDEEKVWEDNFIDFMCGKFKQDNDHFRILVKEAVLWFKTKVIDKRPLKKEDAKAVRMITGYLRRKT